MLKLKLSELNKNNANPRQIKDDKFRLLINSLLTFPEMMELRPIVCNREKVVLGGNMRLSALQFIADMGSSEIRSRITATIKDDAEAVKIDELCNYWEVWKDAPTVSVEVATNLSDKQQREFIIKDNAAFGEWDWDELANEWDAEDLGDWGIDLPTFEVENKECAPDEEALFFLNIEFDNEQECADWYEKLIKENLKCKIIH